MSPNTPNWTPPSGEPPQQPAPRKSWPRRHPIWTVVSSLLGLVIVLGVASAVSLPGASTSGTFTQPAASGTVPDSGTTEAPPAAPAPNPDGTFEGSCDYLLGDQFPSVYHVVGEIDLDNTGNVGVIVYTRISWPQEGSAPITAHKTVKLPAGASKVVRFKLVATSEQIDLLQSWQEHHGFRDGCHYHAAFGTTYGQVQS